MEVPEGDGRPDSEAALLPIWGGFPRLQWYARETVVSGRILVVGDATKDVIVQILHGEGLADAVGCSHVVLEGNKKPDLIIVVGPNAGLLCAEAREAPVLMDVPLLAVVSSADHDAMTQVLDSGATDVVAYDVPPAVLVRRVRNLLATASARVDELGVLHQANQRIQQLISNGGDGPEVLRAVLAVAVEVLGFDRASLIAHIDGAVQSYVIAATDDQTLSKFALTTTSYPEVVQALHTGESVFLDDAQTSDLTSAVVPALKRKGIRGIAVFPVVWQGRAIGVVLFRRARAGVNHVSARKAEFGRAFATQLAAQLHHRKVMDSLESQAHRLSSERYEAQRRLRTLDSLRDHFEAAADGVVVLDCDGAILFVNSAAQKITGMDRDALVGSAFIELVGSAERDKIEHLCIEVLGGTNLDAFDLDVRTRAGTPVCVSVTTSTVMSDSGAVILSFRDVTAERALAGELSKTKIFLERLIDSMVDALVAADMQGNIILFNPGAERIYGYRAHEVVGKLPVWKLYADGGAKQVMRMLRSSSYGGVGRLEQTRREVMSNTGEVVPVNLSASILYENGVPSASVGIFSDLRERIRMEQKLQQAQQKLEITAKQAVIAELAGAAAHELNQPLTSILGYAQLALRRLEPEHRNNRPLQVILQEGERMAELVKKIGRITKFETKQYIGSANILDLDRSSGTISGPGIITDGTVISSVSQEDDREISSADTDRIEVQPPLEHER